MTIILNNDDVKSLFTDEMAIEAIEKSYIQMSKGEAVCRPSIRLTMPTQNPEETYQWGTTEGGSASGYFAIRMMSDVTYQTEHQGVRTQEKYCMQRGTYCGLIFLFRVNNGEPLALLNDGHLQQVRVGVDAALGIKYMARENAAVIGMFGAGGLARSLIDTIRVVRQIKRIQVYDPLKASLDSYVREITAKHGIETVPLSDPQDVYKGADILAECTNAVSSAVILGRYIEPGTHIVTVGRRLDDEAFRKINRWLRFGNATAANSREEVTDEHITYKTPVLRSARPKAHDAGFDRDIDRSNVIYLKDLLDGKQGRRSAAEITYSERGNLMGAQFHAMAGRVYELAKARGMGKEIPTEWLLQDIRD